MGDEEKTSSNWKERPQARGRFGKGNIEISKPHLREEEAQTRKDTKARRKKPQVNGNLKKKILTKEESDQKEQ